MAELRIDHLVKHFDGGDIVAVDDVSFEVSDGEFLVIVGPSGCGKTTTLNCIAGLESPTSGQIFLDGTDIVGQKPQERDIAMVFQNYALYPHMNVRKNIGFGLKMRTSLSEEEINSRVEEAAEMLGITDQLDQRPGELSGGQRQRVALGRAIVREPKLFLLDEPLSNLDAKLRSQMRIEVQDIQQELGVTTVYVTHDQTEAMTMADHIAVMNDGKLQQFGPPLECYHQPVNQFVAGFLGSPSMNFFDVTIADGVLKHSSFEYDLSSETLADLDATTGELILGIRPEDVQLADTDALNGVETSVNVVEPMGDETYLYVDIGGVDCVVNVDESLLIDTGQTIALTFPEDRIHLFDRSTGEALKNRSQATTDIESVSV